MEYTILYAPARKLSREMPGISAQEVFKRHVSPFPASSPDRIFGAAARSPDAGDFTREAEGGGGGEVPFPSFRKYALEREGGGDGPLPEEFQPRLEAANLSRKDAADAMRDPNVLGYAPLMPTRLVKEVTSAAEVRPAWGIEAVQANKSDYTGEGVVVAVLDTGIVPTHPAFAGVQLVAQDFTGTSAYDTHGHGTHCAGTIFGRDVGRIRIGVARGVQRALIAKVLDGGNIGTSSMLFDGLQWAARNGAHVISMSLGFDVDRYVKGLEASGWPYRAALSMGLEVYRDNVRLFDTLMESLRLTVFPRHGTVVLAATGNESNREGRGGLPPYEVAVAIPAAAEGVISVAAAGPNRGDGYTVAPFSNTLPILTAPGEAILSAALNGGLVPSSGTSMACPHVAGVAALWWQKILMQGGANWPHGHAARQVMTSLSMTARPNVFRADFDRADYGDGMVTAPLD